MLEAGQGHIVTVASLAGLFGTNRLTDYCASKFAAVGFDEALKNEIKVRISLPCLILIMLNPIIQREN